MVLNALISSRNRFQVMVSTFMLHSSINSLHFPEDFVRSAISELMNHLKGSSKTF